MRRSSENACRTRASRNGRTRTVASCGVPCRWVPLCAVPYILDNDESTPGRCGLYVGRSCRSSWSNGPGNCVPFFLTRHTQVPIPGSETSSSRRRDRDSDWDGDAAPPRPPGSRLVHRPLMSTARGRSEAACSAPNRSATAGGTSDRVRVISRLDSSSARCSWSRTTSGWWGGATCRRNPWPWSSTTRPKRKRRCASSKLPEVPTSSYTTSADLTPCDWPGAGPRSSLSGCP